MNHNKKPLNVLYVYSGKARAASGGLDLVVRQQIQALVENNYEVTFISRGSYSHQNVRNITFKLTPANLISFLPARYYYHAQHRFFSFVAGVFLNFKSFDLVIGWQLQSYYLFKKSKEKLIPTILNCPVVHYAFNKSEFLSPNFLWPHINDNIVKQEYSNADQIFVASDFAKSTFLENKALKYKIISIGRGADISRFSVSKSKSKSQKFRVVFFGRASERKGIFQALDAWNKASIKTGEFLIIGEVPKELKKDILLIGSANNIKFLGHLKDPEKILKTCSIQILPTRMEGMAKSLIEGAACGLVTLSTKESGFPIIEGVTGYYINRDDIDHIAKKIKFLYRNSDKLEQMSKSSHSFVVKNLTWTMFRFKFLNAVEIFLNKFY